MLYDKVHSAEVFCIPASVSLRTREAAGAGVWGRERHGAVCCSTFVNMDLGL